jgi:hypothetical protein
MKLPFGRVRRVRLCDLQSMYLNPPGHLVLLSGSEDVINGEGAFDKRKAIAFQVEPGGAGRLLANPNVDRHISSGVVVVALCTDEGDAWTLVDWLHDRPSGRLA